MEEPVYVCGKRNQEGTSSVLHAKWSLQNKPCIVNPESVILNHQRSIGATLW